MNLDLATAIDRGGLVLFCIVVVGIVLIGLHKKWFVMGVTFSEMKDTLTGANSELKTSLETALESNGKLADSQSKINDNLMELRLEVLRAGLGGRRDGA